MPTILLNTFINSYFIVLLIFANIKIELSEAKVMELSTENFDHYISTYELVFVNFHAEWCRFSQLLSPVFQVSYALILKQFNETRKVLFATVDCDENPNLSARYQISKYPTLKFWLNAKMLKSEYRGERTESAIVKYVSELLIDPVVHVVFDDISNFTALVRGHASIIGYYKDPPKNHRKYDMFRKVAADLRNYCKFYWVTNAPFLPEGKDEMIAFKSAKKNQQSEYQSVFQSYDQLSTWSTGLCMPVVRVITFNNAEEVIEEGLPLVILFHNANDQESVDWFKLVIHYELIRETSNVNFVTADAQMFGHPLEHLGKTKKDLPLIAIDSFKHMYLFPKFEDLKKGRILARFIQDLKSGKLHRQFHFGSDNQTSVEDKDETVDKSQENEEPHEEEINVNNVLTPVADSVFKKLAPSSNRYTLLRDEL